LRDNRHDAQVRRVDESTASLQLGEERGKSLAQVAGSIVTYLRRYPLASILGMYADEDGDGNEPKKTDASKHEPVKHEPTPTNGNGHSPLIDAIQEEGGVPVTATMSIDTAKAVTNSKGIAYGTLTNDELSNMSIGISKGLKKPGLTQNQLDEYHMKQDAIGVILQSRN